ncbi:MAG: Holliday junction resolvase RuvX [Candidatus Omnitrophica bacterium]|nr:Holliday junction resolvase RuvX [Candidatus Omnitrophota bacterium]
MSLLGLDLGEKRVGVAHSDELNLMAHSLGFIERRNEAYLIHEIKRFIDEFQIQKVVVGFPKTLKGETGSAGQKVLEFVRALEQELACPIATWDERLTTAQAEKVLLQRDVSRAKRKEKRDAMAAQIMLQSYLDFLKQKDQTKHV